MQSFIVHGESNKSVELLNKLSDFMRFSLYECNTELIALQKEAAIIGNYVEIERVRYDDKTDIVYDIQIEDGALQVPPLLFMPLVENAFKYSAALTAAQVAISIKVHSKNGKIYFFVSNHYNNLPLVNSGGIGLQNVRKRLEHYFKNKHTMQVTADKNIFTVTITICPYGMHNSG